MTKQSDKASEAIKAQKRRNMWLGLALVAFVALVGVTTAFRLQASDFGARDRLYFSGYLDEAAAEKKEREQRASTETLEATPEGDLPESVSGSDE